MGHPTVDQIRQNLAENPIVPEGASIEEMRAGFDALGSATPTLPNVTATQVSAGGVDGEWIDAAGADQNKALLYVHGGGYVLGSNTSHRALLDRMAVATGIRVLALNYRLAPEHPFPAPVEDACAGYRFLIEQGIAPQNIAIAGDSAGGGLTIATLVALRDAGDPLPACAVPISPWADMEAAGASMESRAAVDPMVQKEIIMEMAGVYLNGADPKSPLAAPIHADLSGLPPILIQVGDAETLLDDSNRLATKLKTAGVDVELKVWDEMIHVWHLFAPILEEGQSAIDEAAAFITRLTG